MRREEDQTQAAINVRLRFLYTHENSIPGTPQLSCDLCDFVCFVTVGSGGIVLGFYVNSCDYVQLCAVLFDFAGF